MEQEIICKKCGLVDSYKTVQKGVHLMAYCDGCDSYIKNIPQGLPMVLFFGKYKGRELRSMTAKNELEYLQWMYRNVYQLKLNQKAEIFSHLERNGYGV